MGLPSRKINLIYYNYRMGTQRISKFNSTNFKIALLILSISSLLVILSIIAIIYARGSKPTSNGLINTGNIRLNTDVENITVKINGQTQTPKNKLITDLTPGEYTVEITSPGYIKWAKTVQVQEGLVKDLFIRLIPESIKPEKYSSFSVDRLVFASNAEYSYYVVTNAERANNVGIWRERIRDGSRFRFFDSETTTRITDITRSIQADIQAGNYAIIPSKDNKKVVLKVGKDQIRHFLLNADSYNEPDNNNQLETELGYTAESVEWLDDSRFLLVKTANLLTVYDSESQSSQVITYHPENNPIVYAATQEQVYIYEEEQGVGDLKVFSNGDMRKLNLGKINLTGVSRIYASTLDKDILFYQTSAKKYYWLDLNSGSQQEITGNIAEIVTISPTGMGAILKNTAGAFVIFTVEEIKALEEFESRSEIVGDKTIVDFRYTSKGTNLLMLNEKNTLMIADRDGENAISLVGTEADLVIDKGSFNVNSSATKLYFLSTNTDKEKYIYQVLLKKE